MLAESPRAPSLPCQTVFIGRQQPLNDHFPSEIHLLESNMSHNLYTIPPSAWIEGGDDRGLIVLMLLYSLYVRGNR